METVDNLMKACEVGAAALAQIALQSLIKYFGGRCSVMTLIRSSINLFERPFLLAMNEYVGNSTTSFGDREP